MSLMGASSLMGGQPFFGGVFLGASIGTDRASNMTQCLIEKAARGEVKVAIEPARYPRSLRRHPYIESRLAVGRFS
jgi:hypothetical protein